MTVLPFLKSDLDDEYNKSNNNFDLTVTELSN